jgi:hypothetical protein
MVISSPFKGSGWVNGSGCCLEIGPHRFVTNPINGTLDPSETFAIDWVQIDRPASYLSRQNVGQESSAVIRHLTF